MRNDQPDRRRVAAACLSAAASAPPFFLVLMLVGPDGLDAFDLFPFVFLFGFPIAALHVGLLALPAYLLLRRWWRLRWWNAAIGGIVVGAAPVSLLSGSVSSASGTSICGLVGGLSFWAALRGGETRAETLPGPEEVVSIFA